MAAVGGLAYKTFNDWQQQQGTTIRDTGTPIAELEDTDTDTDTDANANKRSEAIVKAMIAAGKSDGHLDAAEQKMIAQKIESIGLEQDITSFLMRELGKPMDVSELEARLA